MKRFKVGVVGLRFGQFLVRTLAHLESAQLVAVADRNPNFAEGLETFAARYGASAYRSSAEMFANEALDAVVIATAPKARAAIIEQAAERGIAMFAEKPWAANPEHAARLAEICRRHNATVMLGFGFRINPAIGRLRELMGGEIGQGWMLANKSLITCRRQTAGFGTPRMATGCSTVTPAIYSTRSAISWASQYP